MTSMSGCNRSGQSRIFFGLPCADEEHDRGRVRRAVVRQAPLPGGLQTLAEHADRVDVVSERQRHDVGVEAVDHRARLRARASMRLLDRDLLAGLGLPMRREGRIEFAVHLAGRIVGHVEQFDLARALLTGPGLALAGRQQQHAQADNELTARRHGAAPACTARRLTAYRSSRLLTWSYGERPATSNNAPGGNAPSACASSAG